MPKKETTALIRAWRMLPMPLMTAMMALPMVRKMDETCCLTFLLVGTLGIWAMEWWDVRS